MGDWKAVAAATAGVGVGAVAAYGCAQKCAPGNSSQRRGEAIKSRSLSYERDHTRWSSEDVATWLVQRGVSVEAAIVFEDENIDGTVLPNISGNDLDQMGVRRIGDRMKIEGLIKNLGETPLSPARQRAVQEERPVVVNPLDPSAGNLPASRQRETAIASPPRAQSPTPESVIDAKYKEIVDSNIESLERVTLFITSDEFKSAPATQQKIQLKKVIELLTNLLSFSEEIPSSQAARMVQHIQAVYTHVKSFGDLDDVDESAAEPTPGVPSAATKNARLAKIQQFKKLLQSSVGEAGLDDIMENLRTVVGDIDNCSDPEELQALNEVFELLQERNTALQKRADELKRQKAEAMSIANAGPEKELMLATQLLNKDFSVIPIAKQEEYLRASVVILSKYMENDSCDPRLAIKIGDLIKAKRDEFEANRLREASGGEGGSLKQKLQRLVLLLGDDFDELSMEKRFEVLEQAYTTLDTITPQALAEHHDVTSELVSLLKKKHGETAKAAGLVDEDEAAEETSADEPSMTDIKKENSESPQNEVNLLPKVYQRLKSDAFVNGATKFEFNTLLWVVAQISQALNKVLSPEQFKELMQPVQMLLMHRMDETQGFPGRARLPGMQFQLNKDDDGAYVLRERDSDDAVSELANQIETDKVPTRQEKPLSALLVGVDSPQGTEALEVQHAAYFLRKELGYDVMALTGKEATSENVSMGIRAASLVLIRSSLEGKDELTLADKSITLSWLRERANDDTSFIIDCFSECTFATTSEEVTIALDESTVPKINGACSWLFDGVFTPLIPDLLSLPEPPTTLGGLVTTVQKYFLGDGPYQETAEDGESLWHCVISRGLVEGDDNDDDDDDDEGEGEGEDEEAGAEDEE
eukprot:TRINITY_DN13620_c0_g4_i1.p1 TRINITY_DN13620_c0_g4~~TRINITY_DN13620_c0_g4_i1.p1  ORF type:complete len:896 (+),score=348.19 TRINITY_DN13620_c0_g4_i1:75-2690(+)